MELAGAPTEWIEREVGELAAHIAAAMARWLELVAELDRRAGHEAWGFHSCGAWLAWRCGIDPRSAREHVRVARALEKLPLAKERFGRGLLSYSKVRAVTRIASPENEAELVEMARQATAAQLERIVRGFRRAVSLESAEAAHRERFLAWEWDEDGSLRVRGNGVTVYELDPGKANMPYHAHFGVEELLVVLRGTPTLRTPGGERELAEGEVVSFPPGRDGAHQLVNRSEAPARFLGEET